MDSRPSSSEGAWACISDRVYVRRFLIGLLLIGLALLTYRLADILLLVFGAALAAVVFRSIADPITRWTGLPSKLAVEKNGGRTTAA